MKDSMFFYNTIYFTDYNFFCIYLNEYSINLYRYKRLKFNNKNIIKYKHINIRQNLESYILYYINLSYRIIKLIKKKLYFRYSLLNVNFIDDFWYNYRFSLRFKLKMYKYRFYKFKFLNNLLLPHRNNSIDKIYNYNKLSCNYNIRFFNVILKSRRLLKYIFFFFKVKTKKITKFIASLFKKNIKINIFMNLLLNIGIVRSYLDLLFYIRAGLIFLNNRKCLNSNVNLLIGDFITFHPIDFFISNYILYLKNKWWFNKRKSKFRRKLRRYLNANFLYNKLQRTIKRLQYLNSKINNYKINIEIDYRIFSFVVLNTNNFKQSNFFSNLYSNNFIFNNWYHLY